MSNVPMFLQSNSGVNRFAYVGRNGEVVGATVDSRSRAVWNAKQQVRNYKQGEVWIRDNLGNWLIDQLGMDELGKQVAKLRPYDEELLKTNSKLASEMYAKPKTGERSPAAAKTGLQSALTSLAATSRTLSHNMAQGFELTADDLRALDTAILAVMELTQVQGPALPPEEVVNAQ